MKLTEDVGKVNLCEKVEWVSVDVNVLLLVTRLHSDNVDNRDVNKKLNSPIDSRRGSLYSDENCPEWEGESLAHDWRAVCPFAKKAPNHVAVFLLLQKSYKGFVTSFHSSISPKHEQSTLTHRNDMSARRKASKPLMEKKRRDRINQSLAELKDLIDATAAPQKNCRRHRMEKADILELTVQYVHRLHARSGSDQKSQREFIDGFLECVKEIRKYLNNREAEYHHDDLLLRHLDTCAHQIRERADVPPMNEDNSIWRPW